MLSFRVQLVVLVALGSLSCTSQRVGKRLAESAALRKSQVAGSLSLPSLGISMPTPRGWVWEPERTGSIGSMLIATWLKPVSPGSELAEARIVFVLVQPQAFG